MLPLCKKKRKSCKKFFGKTAMAKQVFKEFFTVFPFFLFCYQTNAASKIFTATKNQALIPVKIALAQRICVGLQATKFKSYEV